jgi:hypothetical protein
MAQQSVLDIAAIHQLVDQSTSEHSLQVKAKNQQAANSAAEQTNESLTGKWKSIDRTLQSRYSTVSALISVAGIGLYAQPLVDRIVSCQKQIAAACMASPQMIALSLSTEIEFADKARQLLGYVTGLALSLGDINQMKPSDRKLLFDYVLTELGSLEELSVKVLHLVQGSVLSAGLHSANPFASFVSQDKAMARSLLGNAKFLK